MADKEFSLAGRCHKVLVIVLLAGLWVFLARGVLDIPLDQVGVAQRIQEKLAVSGVMNPVTAVLLNFRGYDTLLEIAVLVLAMIGILALQRDQALAPVRVAKSADPVLALMIRLVVPFMFLIAGYLLWAGEKAPGGAFQAGSVLGAAGVLMALSGHVRPAWLSSAVIKASIAAGFVVFIIAAILPMLFGKNLLEYPEGYAKTLIIVIETWLTLSIGVMLVNMFLSSAAAEDCPFSDCESV